MRCVWQSSARASCLHGDKMGGKTQGVMGKPAPEHEKWTEDMEKRVNMK